jgi:hypothetical protein
LLKEGLGLSCLWLLLWALAWAFRFGVLVWAFWCGKLLEGKRITEGKRIAKGNLLKGKEWLKRVDRKSAPRTLTWALSKLS